MSKAASASPVIVIFGITGDLSKRKLLPALHHLLTQKVLDPSTRIIGTSRRAINTEELLASVAEHIFTDEVTQNSDGLDMIRRSLEVVQLDPEKDNDYVAFSHTLDSYDSQKKRDRMLYMALPPEAYTPIVIQLGKHKLNDERTRLLVEKPFGENVATAESLIETMNQYFTEAQIYRIDHYLAKETAQNLLAFRMENPIFSTLWNSDHIETIHIRASETIGIENRTNFYEKTGALRDLIQSHLIQLLAIVMMEQPPDSTSESIHEGKQVFLRSLEPADPAKAHRAQYSGYKTETGNENSFTETYARIEVASRAIRWADTKIILETGKALDEKITEVVIHFKHPHVRLRNQLRFRIQPEEGISLDLAVKKPGFDDQMHYTKFDFSYHDTFQNDVYPDAYERVIMDAVRADQSLFTSSQELLHAWNVVQPILDAWAKNGNDLATYQQGQNYKAQ